MEDNNKVNEETNEVINKEINNEANNNSNNDSIIYETEKEEKKIELNKLLIQLLVCVLVILYLANIHFPAWKNLPDIDYYHSSSEDISKIFNSNFGISSVNMVLLCYIPISIFTLRHLKHRIGLIFFVMLLSVLCGMVLLGCALWMRMIITFKELTGFAVLALLPILFIGMIIALFVLRKS